MRELLKFAAITATPAVALVVLSLSSDSFIVTPSDTVVSSVAAGGSVEGVSGAGFGVTGLINGSAAFPPRAASTPATPVIAKSF